MGKFSELLWLRPSADGFEAIKTRAFEKVFSRFPEHRDAMIAFHDEHVSVSRYAKFDRLAMHELGLFETDIRILA